MLLCRKGLADDGSRFSETELFPGGYFSLVSGIVSVSVGIAVMLMRVLAEIQVNGLGAVDGATWLVGAVMGLVIGLLLFGALMAAFYLSFRAAKRRRVAIEAKLSD